MNNLEKAKKIILEHIIDAEFGIFNTRCLIDDEMVNLYNNNGLIIDICYDWGYFEVFGLSDDEFNELFEFYYQNL